MRIRRKERDLPETQPADEANLPFDQEDARPADPVTSLITEPAPAVPDASPAEPAASPPPAEPAPAAPEPEAAQSEPVEIPSPAEPAASPPPAESASASTAAAPEPEPKPEPEPAQDVAPTLVTEAPEAAREAAREAAQEAAEAPAQTTPEEPVAAVATPVPAPAPAKKPAGSRAPKAEPTMRPPSIGEDTSELLNGSKPVARELPRVIAIANQKGGVGKTTTTVNLGAALAELDYRVLVIDLDPQGNATTGLGVEARNFELSMYDVIMRDQPLEDCIEPTSVKNLFVAPATIDLAGVEIELVPAFSRELKVKRAIETVVDDFDFVLIDCPPSLGLITVNGLAAADEVLVPIQCEYYALEGLSQLLRNVNLVSTNLNETLEVSTIVLTMYDARTRLSVDVANEVREHFAERVCRAVIPRTVRLSEAPSFGQPITTFDPASRGAVAYRELAKEVSNGAPQRTR
jgi:chromosome partitioning protein